MITSDLFGKHRRQPTGCVGFVVFVVMPVMSVVVATLGLLDGATLTLQLDRVEPRIVEEVLDTSGEITRPVQRVVQEGRVNVTATRRLPGLIRIREVRLHDVEPLHELYRERRVQTFRDVADPNHRGVGAFVTALDSIDTSRLVCGEGFANTSLRASAKRRTIPSRAAQDSATRV